VDETSRHVKEASVLDVGAVAAAGAELEARSPADEVAEDFAVAVVVPAGGDGGLGASTDEDCPLGVERELANEAERGRSSGQAVRGDGGDALSCGRRTDCVRLENRSPQRNPSRWAKGAASP
jgi:hypothetical protein